MIIFEKINVEKVNLINLFKLFRRVAAALPGMENTPKPHEDCKNSNLFLFSLNFNVNIRNDSKSSLIGPQFCPNY